jgi:hypothetical protein
LGDSPLSASEQGGQNRKSTFRAPAKAISMKAMLLVGVALVILGVIGLVYEGFTVTHEKKIVDIGPIQASKKEQETIPIPPILSWVAIGAGAVLIFTGFRRTA